MKDDIDSADSFPTADSSSIRIAIIYEDFATGTRAKHFAELLAESLRRPCPLSETIWRSELLEYPPLAAQAARAAAECDYLIVSMRGDHVPAYAMRQWIEAQLDGAGNRGMGLILISNSSQGKWHVVKATRHYFRCVCAVKDVAFFSYPLKLTGKGEALGSRMEEEAAVFELSDQHGPPPLLHA